MLNSLNMLGQSPMRSPRQLRVLGFDFRLVELMTHEICHLSTKTCLKVKFRSACYMVHDELLVAPHKDDIGSSPG